MKNTTSFKLYMAIVVFLLLIPLSFEGYSNPPERQQYYEIRIYHLVNKTQEAMTDNYLRNAYLPALYRAGIAAAGVFKPVETDTAFGKLIYVFIPFNTIEEYTGLSSKLNKDEEYVEAARPFCDAPYDKPPYERLETVLLLAFEDMPHFAVPDYTTPLTGRIYELRSYESATEGKAMKKIEMFNSGGEIGIFKKLGFQPVFYGQVLSGSHMPNLMYMITFSDMKSHDQHWKAFTDSEDWKSLSAKEEYKNTVSKANPYLLHPTSYSDF